MRPDVCRQVVTRPFDRVTVLVSCVVLIPRVSLYVGPTGSRRDLSLTWALDYPKEFNHLWYETRVSRER